MPNPRSFPLRSSNFNSVSLAFAVCALLALPAFAASQARIVRLSDVQGSVQIDKNIGLGFENAFLNLPITQGTQLRTRENGRAEIEFEDGSAMRLGPNSVVEFASLGLDDSGKRVSQVSLVEGMAYVNWRAKDRDQITLNFSRETVTLDRPAHVRADTSAANSHLAVFKGEVEVDGPADKVTVAKNKTATFDTSNDDKSKVADGITEAPLDSWDRNAISYYDQYARNNSSPFGYGISDLNYYGSYTNVPGYGSLWQPYFTGAGWDPFADGAWGWYPGMGYMFASAYPWGWLPYRYGNWVYVPSSGWMWQAGGWNNWLTTPSYTPTTLAHVNSLVAPATGAAKTIVVGKGGTELSLVPSRLMLTNGFAGLGIPRGSLDSLSHLNKQVSRGGSVEVLAAPQFAATAFRGFTFGDANGLEPLTGSSSERGSSSSSGHSGGSHH
jgi:hypothetical protein